ncbi:MAG: hypothetical protein P1S46_06235 [bacterium]|nr:hypothetical protein [bacterium]
MPEINGRLVCCTCGADLGDASDPYRDPDCGDCLDRELRQEMEREAEEGDRYP